MAKKPTNKEMANGIMNNYSNLNLLANYINDYIEFENKTEDFKKFITTKYERIKKENEHTHASNSDANRKDQPGDTSTNTKSKKVGGKSTPRSDKVKT